MTQMTQIQMFSRMPVLERSKITVWEGHLFKRYFFYGSFRYLSSFCRKVFSGAPVKCFPLYRSKYWDFVAFNSPLSERSKLTVWEQRLFKKKKNWYGSFRYVSILRKKVFSGARVQCFSHCGSNNSDSAVFGNADFGEIKYHSLRTTSFLKKIIYGSFRFVSNLRRKVFSGGPVNCIPLYGSSNSDSAIFGNAAFGEIKDHRFLKNF